MNTIFEDNVKTCTITKLVQSLTASVMIAKDQFVELVSKFTTGYFRSSDEIRRKLIDIKNVLQEVVSNQRQLLDLDKNLIMIIKGEVNDKISSYNCTQTMTNRKTKTTYTFTVPKEDQIILDNSITDDGFAESMSQAIRIKEPINKMIFLGELVKTINKSYKEINRKIKKLDERMKLVNDPNNPESKIAATKRTKLEDSLKIFDDRLRSVSELYFAIRKDLIKKITFMTEPFTSLFPKNCNYLHDNCLKFTIKDNLEDLRIMEEKLTR